MTLRSRRVLTASVVLAVLAAFAIPKLLPTSTNGSGRPAAGSGGGKKGASGPLSVTAYVVRSADAADRVRVTGTLNPNEQVDLQSEVPGKIVRIYFREGAAVRKGMLLVKINDADLRAQLASAMAHKDLADAKELRQRTLREKDAISQAEYDVALSEMKTAAADIELLKAQIAKTEIRAPFAGMIGLRNVSEGSYISPSTKIATLTNVAQLKVDFAVSERYASVVRPGNTITFTVQGASHPFIARVYAVEPRIENQTRSLDVRALCASRDNALRPGAFAEIEVTLGHRSGALMIPSQSVIPDAAGAKVFVAANGTAQSRAVDLGLRTDRRVEVTRGLADGDTVLTTGILQAKTGMRLKISSFETL